MDALDREGELGGDLAAGQQATPRPPAGPPQPSARRSCHLPHGNHVGTGSVDATIGKVMGDSLVLELQRLAQTSDTDVAELLRQANVVAAKLDIDDARLWIDHEMNGYPLGG